MVHTLFESILGNKVLEERLQKAAGRRHAKHKEVPSVNGGAAKPKDTPPNEATEAQKRKFDDMEFGYSNGPPAPQMSYERSRPQSPALTPAREMSQNPGQQQMPQMARNSPPVHQQNPDAFLGTSRQNTRPNTPFNNFSYPSTPPDLFLHTRNSPKISGDLWQNYQPDQLFPPETNNLFPLQSPDQQMVDPALRGMSQTHQGPFAPPQPQSQSPTSTMHAPPQANMQQQQQQMYADPNGWQYQGGMQRPDDQWSNTSGTSAIVPTTLNVGDWFEFFGLPNGDIAGVNAQQGAAGGYG